MGTGGGTVADERGRPVKITPSHRLYGIGAILLIGAPGGPKIAPTVSLFQLTGYILFIAAGVLVLRVLFAVFSNR